MMRRLLSVVAAGGLATAVVGTMFTVTPVMVAAEEPVRLPAPTLDPADGRTSATAIFAGGCFWGIEGVFSRVRGVTRVESGYHGGTAATASYSLIGTGTTGHAESVRITYDPRVVSYGTLLRVLFSVGMDPTTLNYQGPDHGTQYRSAIVPLNANQRRVASAYIAQLTRGRHFDAPIVTRIEEPRTFYPAEAYHQDFMRLNPNHGYIRAWDAPKLAALQRFYPQLVSNRWAP
jgi:peptide-methionine (S)-S-oxide reductase